MEIYCRSIKVCRYFSSLLDSKVLILSIYIYKNGHTDVCLFVLFVRPSVGMWRANGNPNPCTDLDEILHAHPHMSKEGFGTGLTPAPCIDRDEILHAHARMSKDGFGPDLTPAPSLLGLGGPKY